MCRELHCKQDTLNNYLAKMGINYEGNMSGKGFTKNKSKMNLIEYLEKS